MLQKEKKIVSILDKHYQNGNIVSYEIAGKIINGVRTCHIKIDYDYNEFSFNIYYDGTIKNMIEKMNKAIKYDSNMCTNLDFIIELRDEFISELMLDSLICQ